MKSKISLGSVVRYANGLESNPDRSLDGVKMTVESLCPRSDGKETLVTCVWFRAGLRCCRDFPLSDLDLVSEFRTESGRVIRPRNNLVYIRLDQEKESRSRSGLIVLPDSEKQASYGTVVAVGPGKRIETGPREGERTPVEVEAGQKVVFSKYGGATIHVDGEDLLVIQEEHVLGAVEE